MLFFINDYYYNFLSRLVTCPCYRLQGRCGERRLAGRSPGPRGGLLCACSRECVSLCACSCVRVRVPAALPLRCVRLHGCLGLCWHLWLPQRPKPLLCTSFRNIFQRLFLVLPPLLISPPPPAWSPVQQMNCYCGGVLVVALGQCWMPY